MAYVPGRGLSDLVTRVEGAAKALQRAKGAGWTVDDVALDKLRWLEQSGRDFRKVTPALKKKMEGAFVKALDDVLVGKAGVDAPAAAAVKVFKDEIVRRLKTSGGDVAMTPLKDATVKAKGHSRIGDDTGDLKRRVTRAKVRTVR